MRQKRDAASALQEAIKRVPDESKPSRQDEVEQLLSEAQQSGGPAPAADPPPAADSSADDDAGAPLDQAAIEALLSQSGTGQSAPKKKPNPAAVEPSNVEGLLDDAQKALSSIDAPSGELPPGVKPFELRNLSAGASPADAATLDLLRDVQLDLKIELGRTHMQLEDVLQLKKGAVVTLDKLAGDPVDVIVNGRLIARGEVLVLNDNFCVRVAELIAGESAA